MPVTIAIPVGPIFCEYMIPSQQLFVLSRVKV